jgi:coenzyme F420-reducing hydrogenase gamma subunit
MSSIKPTIAVHKFSSCDGCQLAFLNLGEDLLTLMGIVDVRHFAEAGILDEDAQVDIAFVEGSLSTPDDLERIQRVRAQTKYLITIGACATAGGLQALRNLADAKAWTAAVYASPEYISSLDKVQPIRAAVHVDFELWGCPVNGRQVLAATRALLFGVAPIDMKDKVCLECKRQQAVCVMVARGEPCLGPVTRTGCGALCPSFGRACYGCYGAAENANIEALGVRMQGLGLPAEQIAQHFETTTNQSPVFAQATARWRGQHD